MYACCAHITDFGLITTIPKNIGSFYTQNESLYNKLSFDIKGLLYKELAPYKAMDFTHRLIIQYNSRVMLHNYPPFCLT